MRKLGSFLLGDGLGGAGVHWNGMNFRFSPYDFQIKTMTDERYGKNKLGKEYILQDYPSPTRELEPYYYGFRDGSSALPESGVFWRQAFQAVCHAPLVKTPVLSKFETAAKQTGCHPYMIPAAIASEPIPRRTASRTIRACTAGSASASAASTTPKAEPNNTFIPVAEKNGNCEIRCNANVVEILKKGNKVTGVRYIDTLTLEEFIQPADVVVLSSYVMNNAKLLMVSKIGKQYDPKTGRARWQGLLLSDYARRDALL